MYFGTMSLLFSLTTQNQKRYSNILTKDWHKHTIQRICDAKIGPRDIELYKHENAKATRGKWQLNLGTYGKKHADGRAIGKIKSIKKINHLNVKLLVQILYLDQDQSYQTRHQPSFLLQPYSF
jgi:hypothetical protein